MQRFGLVGACMQGAELADMALQNIPLMITMHLAWSLWAFSFSHIALAPPVDMSFLLQYTVVPVATFISSSESTNLLVTRVTEVCTTVSPRCFTNNSLFFRLSIWESCPENEAPLLLTSYCMRYPCYHCCCVHPDFEANSEYEVE